MLEDSSLVNGDRDDGGGGVGRGGGCLVSISILTLVLLMNSNRLEWNRNYSTLLGLLFMFGGVGWKWGGGGLEQLKQGKAIQENDSGNQ